MGIPDEHMEILKKIVASHEHLSPEHRDQDYKQARRVLQGLRSALDGMADDDLANVAYVFASILAALSGLPVRDLAETLDNSTGSYSLAAAHLLSLCDISEAEASGTRKGGDYIPGGYL